MTTDKVEKEIFPINPTDSKPSKSGSAFPTILGIAAVVFGLDQITKHLVHTNLEIYESWSLFPALSRVFRFTYITNTGAAFGMFPQFGGAFMVIAVIVIAGIVLFYHHLPTENIWIRVSLGLQLGGALGNVVDRIARGYVVDFVDIGFWPIFNLADVSIVLGVAILAYFLWDEEEQLVEDRPESQPRLYRKGETYE